METSPSAQSPPSNETLAIAAKKQAEIDIKLSLTRPAFPDLPTRPQKPRPGLQYGNTSRAPLKPNGP